MEPESDRTRSSRQEERISPREVEIIKYRDNRTPLLVKLVTGEVLEGAIRWYDDRALRLPVAGVGAEDHAALDLVVGDVVALDDGVERQDLDAHGR